MTTLYEILNAAFLISVEEDGDYTTVAIGWAWPVVLLLSLCWAVME